MEINNIQPSGKFVNITFCNSDDSEDVITLRVKVSTLETIVDYMRRDEQCSVYNKVKIKEQNRIENVIRWRTFPTVMV